MQSPDQNSNIYFCETNGGACTFCYKKKTLVELKYLKDSETKKTLLCPDCMVDSVIPNNVTDEELQNVHYHNFGSACFNEHHEIRTSSVNNRDVVVVVTQNDNDETVLLTTYYRDQICEMML